MHLPIGEYLYKMKFEFDDKIKSLVERDVRKKKEQAECQYVGPKSQRLLKRLKERGYQQIFDILDDDKVPFSLFLCHNLCQSVKLSVLCSLPSALILPLGWRCGPRYC